MGETDKQKLGKWGEEIATHFLIEKNYEIIERNYSLPKKGEIDIVAWHTKKTDQKTLCFVEVKTRSHDDASAERAVGKKKMSALFIVAKDFCFKNNIDLDKTYIQFEQVSIYKNKLGEDIKHYEIPM